MGSLVLSIFPGVDLLGMAFEKEGFTVVRGPDLLWGGNILDFHPPASKFDGVIGGPPCQEFSPLVHMLRATGREPRHPNLIPEFERCVDEAQPAWFLMENVPPAPLPVVPGYAITSFLLCPTWLGEAQRRVRRFTFGLRGGEAPDLRRWIAYAALELPEVAPTVTQYTPDNSDEAKGRTKTLTITGNARQIPVRLGGNGKVKRPAVTSHIPPGQRVKTGTVLAGHGPVGRGTNYGTRMKLSEMCELQGLPADFLAEAPFTMDGKRQVVGNGVAIPVGVEVARAVKKALEGR